MLAGWSGRKPLYCEGSGEYFRRIARIVRASRLISSSGISVGIRRRWCWSGVGITATSIEREIFKIDVIPGNSTITRGFLRTKGHHVKRPIPRFAIPRFIFGIRARSTVERPFTPFFIFYTNNLKIESRIAFYLYAIPFFGESRGIAFVGESRNFRRESRRPCRGIAGNRAIPHSTRDSPFYAFSSNPNFQATSPCGWSKS